MTQQVKETIIKLPAMHSSQRAANEQTRRFNMLCCGRRWGKDVLLMRRAILRTQQGYPQGWFAPSYRMMTENYKAIYNYLAPIVLRSSASEHTIELEGGAVIDFWSLDNYDAARGRKYGYITGNEISFSPNFLDAWNFVIRPTLADLQGGADFGFTPRGMNGAYTLWAQAGDSPEWSRAHYTTWDNPFIPPTEIEAMKEALPERTYKQEIMAEFLEDGAFFQGVDKVCVLTEFGEPKDHTGHSIVAGLDWALSEDFTVLTIFCGDCHKAVEWYRINRLDFTMQRREIIQRLNKWGARVLPERNSIGAPNIEMLVQANQSILQGPDGGLGFNTTAATKAELIQRLATGIEHGELLLPRDFADELRAYEVTTTLSGNPKFGAPEGLHDDRVISAALAWWSVANPTWWMS